MMGHMSLPQIDGLHSLPALEHPELVSPRVAAALASWSAGDDVAVVEIDPALADTAAMSEAYSLSMDTGANCVVVAGRRGGEERVAACVVRADTRADVNNLVKRTLDVRKASFLSMERAVEESGMEYGGITPLGLPRTGGSSSTPACRRWRWRSSAPAYAAPSCWCPATSSRSCPGAEVVDGLAG